MKKLLFLIVIVAFVSCQTGNKKAESKVSEIETVKVAESTVNIGGMHCANCVASVEKGINSLAGIESVAVSLNDSNAIVKFDASQTDLAAIKKAIEKRGYTIIE
jgi:copper ion binding protein